MKIINIFSIQKWFMLVISIVCVTSLHSTISNDTKQITKKATRTQSLSSRLSKYAAAGFNTLNTMAQLSQMQTDAVCLEENLTRLLFNSRKRGFRHVGRCALSSIIIATLGDSIFSRYGATKPSESLGITGKFKLAYGVAQLLSIVPWFRANNHFFDCDTNDFYQYVKLISQTYAFTVTVATLASHGYHNIKDAYKVYIGKSKQNSEKK